MIDLQILCDLELRRALLRRDVGNEFEKIVADMREISADQFEIVVELGVDRLSFAFVEFDIARCFNGGRNVVLPGVKSR
jgi:hypothetical protein